MNDKRNLLIPYDELVQDALRGVVRDLLRQVEESGLPGQHHFYIAFSTQYPGVVMPEELKERYPEDMTIVLQHRFWDLAVHDDRFEVGLSFNRKPAHLVIPFKAILGFVDPYAQFALQFEPPKTDAPMEEPTIPTDAQRAENQNEHEAEKDTEADKADAGAKVVTLDAFRKKR